MIGEDVIPESECVSEKPEEFVTPGGPDSEQSQHEDILTPEKKAKKTLP